MKSIKKILCAVDFSEHSVEVAEYAVTVANAFSAEVVVAYVAPLLTQFLGVKAETQSVEKFSEEFLVSVNATMNAFLQQHFSTVPTEGHVLTGYASEELLLLANETKADVIIMGTHGHKGVKKIIFGSVAEQIVKSSPIPVVTIRPVG